MKPVSATSISRRKACPPPPPRIGSSAVRLLVPAFPVCLIAAFAVFFTASAALAEPHVRIAVKHYAVRGLTAQEIRQDLNRRGIKSPEGRTYDAFTRWYIKWNYGFRNEGNRCAVQNVRTSVDVTYTLPKWGDERKAPRELADRWQRYMKDLKTHEDGHRDIGIAAAADIEKAIGRLSPAADCREMEAKANAAARSVLDDYHSKESLYDLRTLHGKTQGATFP